MSEIIYYVCEQDDIDHDFKVVELTVNRTLYPQALFCRRCGSVFDLGSMGSNIMQVVDQLSGTDLTQYKLKEATKTNQAVILAKKIAKAARSTPEGEANLKEVTDTLLTAEEKAKMMPNASPWRMNG
ncbi:hypothetical protein LCGC14_0442900 [marine sediment metagenome]|uniref:Uncharacterized protein n=1 Tax=marine sediment metagenome TaxID=412755 RepID=A0A0F9SK07_9ZZZZ